MAAGSRKVIFAALIGNTLIAICKFGAALITGSAAMLAEGIHSTVDTGNQILLLHGIKKAKQPPDERFPFGHGKEIYFWSFVVAILIFAVGAGVSIYEGILHIRHPRPIENAQINYIVLGLAFIFEGAAWFFALHEFTRAKGKWGYVEAVQRSKDPTLFVVLFEDSAALIGIVIAFFGVYLSQVTGILYLDGLASVLIGLLLAGTAIWLAYETKGLLIGEGAMPGTVRGIREILGAHDHIEAVNEVLTLHMGPNYVLVNVSVDFRNDITADQVERGIARIDQDIKQLFLNVKRVFIEAEAKPLEPEVELK